MFKRTMLAMMLVTLAATAAWAHTDEEKCISARAKAKAKYEYCVGKWLAKVYGTAAAFVDTKAQEKLVLCRSKYFSVWPKLQTLSESPTCNQKRFADNIDGTVTDNLTGLIWEKKDRGNGVHDFTQTWTLKSSYESTRDGTGTAFTIFLPLLNSSGYGGASDWRLPTLAELLTILVPGLCDYPNEPCVPSVFDAACVAGCTVDTCSCTWTDVINGPATVYWVYTIWALPGPGQPPADSWTVSFVNATADRDWGDGFAPVRAVRGGL